MSLSISEEAKLLLSLGTHKKNRPLSPLEASDFIKRLLDDGGATIPKGTKSQIAQKLGFSGEKMIDEFLSLQELPATIREAIGWGGMEDGRLPFSTGAQLAKLRGREQDVLAKVALEHNFTKTEIIRIVQLRLRNPSKTINECIEDIKRIRPVVHTGYVVVTHLSEDAVARLHANALASKLAPEDVLKLILSRTLQPESIKSIVIRKRFLILTLDEDGYRRFKALPDSMKIAPEEIADRLVRMGIGNP